MSQDIAVAATTTFTLEITYNGITKLVKANAEQTVQALLEHAMNAFAIHQNRHTMALYPKEGPELTDSAKLGDLAIQEGTLLLLRPSAVKGG